MVCARVLALDSAGRSKPARVAMIAVTTNSSTRVKADRLTGREPLAPGEGAFSEDNATALFPFINPLVKTPLREFGVGAEFAD